MKNKIKISAVSYLNTLPFIYGLENSPFLSKKIILTKDIPSVCADKLINNEVDLGLIPVAEINKIKNPRIISDYCIGANGKVDSVLLLSNTPVEKVDEVLLDYQSRTSVNLTKILLKKYFKINPEFKKTEKGYEENFPSGSAALIIGDRAFKYKNKFEYVYDLSEIWMKFTSYPFVFAVWTANKELDEDFIKEFNNALKFGLQNTDKSIAGKYSEKLKQGIDLKKYLTENINYYLDSEKRKGMQLFLDYLKEI